MLIVQGDQNMVRGGNGDDQNMVRVVNGDQNMARVRPRLKI